MPRYTFGMSKELVPKYKGVVTEALPNAEFLIESDMSIPEDRRPAPRPLQIVRCYTSGKMRKNRIRILIADRVEFEYPPGSSVGRITRRF
jgi:translation initiation factor IF-1